MGLYDSLFHDVPVDGNLRFCGVYHTTSQLKLEVTTNMQSSGPQSLLTQSVILNKAYKIL